VSSISEGSESPDDEVGAGEAGRREAVEGPGSFMLGRDGRRWRMSYLCHQLDSTRPDRVCTLYTSIYCPAIPRSDLMAVRFFLSVRRHGATKHDLPVHPDLLLLLAFPFD
jgi:hypothetical protein